MRKNYTCLKITSDYFCLLLQGKEKQYNKKINNLQKAVEQLRLEVNIKEENLMKTNLKLLQIVS